MVKLTPDLILEAMQYFNPAKERELSLRGNKIPTIENLGVTSVRCRNLLSCMFCFSTEPIRCDRLHRQRHSPLGELSVTAAAEGSTDEQ